MTTYDTLLVEQQQHVVYVTLNRPTALNALNTPLRRDLKQCFTDLQADPDVRVVVITGAGRAFCAGADIKEWREPTSVVEDREDRLRLNFWQAMSRCEAPIIAAINGYALGGGCELAMCCDMRVASDQAQLGLTEVTLGIIPGGGGTQRLPRLVGRGKALELILTGRRIDAPEALRLGLVEQVVPHDQLKAGGRGSRPDDRLARPVSGQICQRGHRPRPGTSSHRRLESRGGTLYPPADDRRSDGRGQGLSGKTPTAVQGTLAHPLPVHWRTPWTR